ncbi:MAG: hypothetical protein ACRC7O_08830 [Fimbriiglobus sp.]
MNVCRLFMHPACGYDSVMPNLSRKPKLPDPNTTAFRIVQAISGEHAPEPPADGKRPCRGGARPEGRVEGREGSRG